MAVGEKTLHDLLAPISQALGHTGVPEIPLVYSTASSPTRVTDGLNRRERIEMFMSEARKIHVDVYRCTPGEVASTVSAIIASADVDAPSVVIAADEYLEAFDIADAVDQAFVWGSTGTAEENIARAKTARFGITSAACGIAETGTVMLAISAQSPRSVSLLPLAHIAVLEADDIVGTLGDCLRAMGNDAEKTTAGAGIQAVDRQDLSLTRVSSLPSQVCFVSGPSATADIELVRVEGVHGPMYEHYIVVDRDGR